GSLKGVGQGAAASRMIAGASLGVPASLSAGSSDPKAWSTFVRSYRSHQFTTDGGIVDISTLLHILERGESDRLEFEARLPSVERVAQILTAFANSDGGTLIIGVDDGGDV